MAQKFYFVHTNAYDAITATATDDNTVAVYFTDDGSTDFPHSVKEAEAYDISNIIGSTAEELEYYRNGTLCGVIDNFDPNTDEETSISEYTPNESRG